MSYHRSFASLCAWLCKPERSTIVPLEPKQNELHECKTIGGEVSNMKFQISPYGTHQFQVCKEETLLYGQYGGDPQFYWAPVYYKSTLVENFTIDDHHGRWNYVSAIFDTEKDAERMINLWISHENNKKRAEEAKRVAEELHRTKNPPRIYPC